VDGVMTFGTDYQSFPPASNHSLHPHGFFLPSPVSFLQVSEFSDVMHLSAVNNINELMISDHPVYLPSSIFG
jgi:hypothetical protein